jgi:hypothetical protein
VTWLGADLNMLEADADQLRRHLGWLLEDLHVYSASLDGRVATIEVLVDQLAGCLDRCEQFAALLRQVRQATEIDASAAAR